MAAMLPLDAVETPAGSVSEISTMMSSLTDMKTVEGDDQDFGPLVSPVYLSGRAKETLLLLKTYLKLRMTKTSQLALLHGESGSGKTALVDSLRTPVFDNKGYFVSGKYFQNSGVRDPYSAIMTAFSDLCDLLLQDTSFDENRRVEIQQALGSDGPILARAISSLNTILNLSEDLVYLSSGESSMKNEAVFTLFKVACKKFLNVMSAQNPVVVFIDDIQWMDEGSRQLLRSLLGEAETKNILFILSYREESSDSVAAFVNEAKAGTDHILDIDLQNLDAAGVYSVVSAYLKTTSPKVQQLSELVYQRTMGNCYYLQQFLESIQRDELLAQGQNGRWMYDVDEIRCETKVSNNLADILSRKIQRLATEIKDILKIASLLGYRFDRRVIAGVIAVVPACAPVSSDLGLDTDGNVAEACSVATSLNEALSSGFVEKSNECHQFTHDKVQASFQSTMDDFEKANLHRLIAETYLSLNIGDELSGEYHAANHFHQAGVPPNEQEKVRQARLNLVAASFCIDRSAFIDAAELLRRGLALLDKKRMWIDEFDLTFELTETLARMELVLGNLTKCTELAALAMELAKTIDMKIDLMFINCEARMADNQVEMAISLCHSALRLLGMKIPSKVTAIHVLFRYLNVRRLIGNKSDEDLLQILLLEDRRLTTIIRFLFYISSYCSVSEKEHETVYYSLLGMQLSLQRGLSPFSAPCMIIYALAETAVGNHDRGDRFGKVALRLLDKIPSKEAAIPTMYMAEIIPLHWRKRIEETRDSLDDVISLGDEVGDALFSIGALADAFATRMMTGMSLPSLEEFIRFHFQRFDVVGENDVLLSARPTLLSTRPIAQFVLNLQVSGANFRELANLDGEMMNERSFQRVCKTTKIMLWTMRFFKLQLAFHFGCYQLAAETVKDMTTKGPLVHYNFYTWYFYGALVHLQLYRLAGRRTNLKIARHYYKGLLLKSACPNARPFLAILAAEMLWVKKGSNNQDTVIAAYQNANATANELGYCHMEALSNERAAEYLTSSGLQAKPYLDRALDLYRNEWQATAKYEWLLQKSETNVTISTWGGASFVGNFISVEEAARLVSNGS